MSDFGECMLVCSIFESGDGKRNVFHLKRSWKVYILSILSTVVLFYLADPLMLLYFPNQVTTTFSMGSIPKIALMALLGTAAFIECLGEELGWIGYLYPRLEKIMGTALSCVVLGIIRGAYHIGILVLMEYPLQMFAEITISNICLSFWMIYLYKKSNSIFPCSIQHGISNLLPIFLIYESSWYYTSVLPMVICMLPAALFGAFGLWRMAKTDTFVKR